MHHLRLRWLASLSALLRRWSERLSPGIEQQPLLQAERCHLETLPLTSRPGVLAWVPLPMEQAVLDRDLTMLRRDAADAVAALGAAHALIASARLSTLQDLRGRLRDGAEVEQELLHRAADYLGWHSDQVRLFDATRLLLEMRVPEGTVLEQIDPDLHAAARDHLGALAIEHQRSLLAQQFHSQQSGD
ncbi:MAG: hypothetical protein VKI83_02895 [Synechococcaceae cyanobacterium]|nr:hypothetical protein [Synechococcaceae cyanobacterium]